MVTPSLISKAAAKSQGHCVVTAAVQGHTTIITGSHEKSLIRRLSSQSSKERITTRLSAIRPWASLGRHRNQGAPLSTTLASTYQPCQSIPCRNNHTLHNNKNNNNNSPAAPSTTTLPTTLGASRLPFFWNELDPQIAPYVQSCDEHQSVQERERKRNMNTEFHVCFLGTGSGNSMKRRPSCTFVNIGKEGLIFDVGEGSERQIKSSTMKLGKVSRIFITHLHSDHVLGLPGLLLSSNLANLFDDDATLQLYGPPGLYNFVVMNMALTQCKLRMMIEVNELVGGQCRVHWKQRGMMGNFPQFQHDNVVRKAIRCDEEGVWRIKDLREITRGTSFANSKNDFTVAAAELFHVPNVPTFGFVIQERLPLPKIDADKAKSLGIAPSGKYVDLKHGFSVMNDDKTRLVQPSEVLVDTVFKARKLAILGDNCGSSLSMEKLSENADLIIHEATLREDNHAMSTRRGHSTASMAGRFADTVKADLLVLNHLGDSAGASQDPSKDALTAIKGGTRVLTALDMMEIAIPRTGFQFRDSQNDQDTSNSLLPQQGISEIFEDWKEPSKAKVSHAGLLPKEGTKITREASECYEPDTIVKSASI